MSAYVTVIGGANNDIVGLPDALFVPGDSNPGHVRSSPGGVARNIAENLARLGVDVRLVTVFGGDHGGVALRSACESTGIDTSASMTAGEVPGCRYLAVLDEHGGLAGAVSDMRAMELLTPDALDAHSDLIAGSTLVVADANLSAAVLERLAEICRDTPLVLDAVSVPKAPRLRAVLSRTHTLKANLAEAALLADVTDPTAQAVAEVASRLLAKGVSRVFITMGEVGAAYADASAAGTLSAPDVTAVNTTGAGDAFMAGVVFATLRGADALAAARAGRALAALAIASESTVSEAVSAAAVEQAMEG